LGQEAFCPFGTEPESHIIFCDNIDWPAPWAGDLWSTYHPGVAPNSFTAVDGVGINGSPAMAAYWDGPDTGQNAGYLTVGLGQLPDAYDDPDCDSEIYPCENWYLTYNPTEKYTELWTRQYVKLADGWDDGCTDLYDTMSADPEPPQDEGDPDHLCDEAPEHYIFPHKFHRFRVLSDYKLAAELEAACVGANDPYDCCTGFETDDGNCEDDFPNGSHPTAYQGHFWQQPNTAQSGTIGGLYFNSTRGVDENGVVVDTGNNCSESSPVCSHVWMPQVRGSEIVFTDSAPTSAGWFCIESHVMLNDPGETNGVEEFFVSAGIGEPGILDARNSTQNMVYSYSTYGINQIVFDNYWNGTSPASNTLYRDNFVIGTERIGCALSVATEPTGVLAWQPPWKAP
jgi:hypothetical protein